MVEYDLTEFLKYYVSKFIIILIAIIFGFCVALVYTKYIQVPLYKSHTSIVLTRTNNKTTITENDVSLNKNLVATYREIIKSRLILSQVIKNLNLQISEEELSKSIVVSSVDNTELIDIAVFDEEALAASNIANEIAKVFKNEITSIYNIENVSIVDTAVAASKPDNIHPFKQYLLGIFGGFFISSIIIFIMFTLDDTIKKREEIEEKIGYGLVGSIPRYQKNKNDADLILKKDPKNIISESFRTIRTNLNFMSIDKKNKTFLITSSMPGEGKSFISSNLAIALAQSGERVLLVDCDIRKGRQHKIFGYNNQKGLSNLLLDENYETTYQSYIVKTKIKNLSILFRGATPPNPSELLGSKKLKDLIKILEQKYDAVIFDSAPINGGLTDSLILSNLVDGIIIVSSYKRTPISLLKDSKNQIEKSKANVLGVILNRVDIKKTSRYYGHYY